MAIADRLRRVLEGSSEGLQATLNVCDGAWSRRGRTRINPRGNGGRRRSSASSYHDVRSRAGRLPVGSWPPEDLSSAEKIAPARFRSRTENCNPSANRLLNSSRHTRPPEEHNQLFRLACSDGD